MKFQSIDPKALRENPFGLFSQDWMLLTAGDKRAHNTMTVSWGGLGVLWGKNVATCYVRPQRHTYGFMERGDYFTLAAFEDGYREALSYCGSASGRDGDKAAHCGFTADFAQGDAPYYREAKLVLVCRKIYWQDFDPGHFLTESIEKCYPTQDYHRMYIGEVLEVLIKDE